MQYAKRVDTLSPSSIREMMTIARRLVGEGKTVYELNIGEPDIKCIQAFSDAVSERLSTGHLRYSPYIGEQFLRETYARYINSYFDRTHRRHLIVESENVVVTCGASQALSNVFLTICEPGDEVLGIEPFFSPYSGFVSISGATLKTVSTFAEQNFVLPPDEEIEKLITPKTRAILFNSPCNPSGKIFTSEEVTRLAKLAVKHDLFLVADEVYREMILGDEEAFSVLEVELPEDQMEAFMNRIIVVDSASKTFSLCGARVGFAVARAPIVQKISLVQAHTVACVSDVLQYGVTAAYDYVLRKPEYFAELRKIYRDRLEATMAAIKEYLPWVVAPRPAGAFYLMIQFPGIDDINDFSLFLLEKFNIANETVCLTPAMSFYQTAGRGTNEVRLAIVLESEKLRRSMFIISEACKAYKARLKSHCGLHPLA